MAVDQPFIRKIANINIDTHSGRH